MRATILIVVMILLQTGALSLGLMFDRRFITAAARLNRKIGSTAVARSTAQSAAVAAR
jgi:hypothetical protein